METTSNQAFCFSCKKALNPSLPVGRREECPHCHADVHVCRNCQFYDRSSYNECKEPSADVVKEKDRSNFCDFFVLRCGSNPEQDRAAQLRAAAEALFKKN